MRRRLIPVVPLVMIASAVLLLCYMTVWLVLSYQIRRAAQLIAEAQHINVGASEDSIRPMFKRYGGFRSDLQQGYHEDFNYVLEINPWHFPWHVPALSSGRSGERVHSIENALNPRFRRAIGFRQWIVESDVAIKQHRVVAVQTVTLVEGRRMWLGNLWSFSEKPQDFEPSVESDRLPFEDRHDLATGGIVEAVRGSGIEWTFWTTPSSPEGQRKMANQLNFACLRSLSGCDTMCDLMPAAARFFWEHSELAPNGGGWDNRLRTCLKGDPRESQYQ
jgi:hypothetical protein